MDSPTRSRAHELESDGEVDIVDYPESEESAAWEALDKADDSAISRSRSMNRSSKQAGNSEAPEKKSKCATSVNVSPHQRVREFPGECLVVSSGKLYCEACSHIVNLKKSVIEKHVESSRHNTGKQQLKEEGVRQQRIADSWKRYLARHSSQLSGTGLSTTIPLEESLRRISVVEQFLKAGVPLAKVDTLRPLLEQGSQRLTHSSHMGSYVPFVLEGELDTIKEELKEHPYVSAIFDGSTYLGEALVIILRFVTADFEVCQRLVRVRILAKSLNGQQLAREIVTLLASELHYPPEKFIAVTRDGASVNAAAVRHLRDVMYPDLTDITCMSHSLDNVGKHFNTPVLDSFLQTWISLFAHSPAAKIAWRNTMGEAVKSYSATRWWSWWEMVQQLHRKFAQVPEFLRELAVSAATRACLLQVIDDDERLKSLRLQMAITVDFGKIFVEKTYILEGDGELIATAYTHLQEISTAAALGHSPYTLEAAQEIAGDNPAEAQRLVTEAKDCVRPAIDYFRKRFNHCQGNLFQVIQLLKVLQILCPIQAHESDVGLRHVEALRALPCLDQDATINALMEELPVYLVAATNAVIDGETSRLKWWKRQVRLPTWQRVAMIVFTLLPSSAPAERVFSLLQASIGQLQGNMLSDQIEASLMLQYNRGKCSK